MTAAYVALVIVGMAILLLAAWWRCIKPIPPWRDADAGLAYDDVGRSVINETGSTREQQQRQ